MLIWDYIIAILGSSGLASALTWLVSKRKRNNDFLNDLQGSINTLADSYTRTLAELVNVKHQNANLLQKLHELQHEVQNLQEDNAKLLSKIQELQHEVKTLKTENAGLLKKIIELKTLIKAQ
jgi:predicted nuclease with TOPRIM domain